MAPRRFRNRLVNCQNDLELGHRKILARSWVGQKEPDTRQANEKNRSIPMMVCEDFLEEANEVDGLFHQPTKKGRHPPKNAALDKERKGALSSS
ncbi:MAG: hypothetical protein A2W61_03585 [Deltaproteobacteria bacterium RIFCSPLOWO2_01_44_7]|nr:MAG: hypothetical protein A2712_08430 [Deltaproteobacteria bacterium RIFCSPHIGHO2_01_FULL_43_49]OGQ14636.1 MAG: hypothetical protein A3D22_08570 [Deltaproteobacteria bacterium RIFCSPHIGHO2_02_FULL_44_53]OGQ28022.1 MAG: hypothetical protein A3D98_07280 [Deltaproteobacteria bacterium RIFCSPHIGHO2_12_FULL_44_21]OGQ31234.1 MAG: hypothetical protein A2979_07330 [Deltaproteobacteria bacterium RIFCSPLOWO2_01_FULL_45_74]OGQ42693.1 MAG: hypothetical protein A2W61_03585 [Deltaproteobacteria bacterium 